MNRPFGLLAPRLLTLAVSVALAAIHGTASPQAVATRGDATSRAEVAAIALARAIADGDTAAVVKTMLDDVVLIQSDRSVVTGSSAVASALLRTRFAAGEYRLLYEITESFGCLTGTVQTGAYVVMGVRNGEQESVERGTMAIGWTEIAGEQRVNRVALVADGNAVLARRALGAHCSRLDAKMFTARRFEVSIIPASVSGWAGGGHLEASLAGQGWTRPPAINLFRSAYQADQSDVIHHGRTDPGMTWVGAVSMRIAGQVRVAASIQPAATSTRLLTYNEAQSSRLTQDVALRESTLGLTAERWRLRFGLSAALITSKIQERYEELVLHDPASPTGSPGRGTVEDEHYAPSAIGGVGTVQYGFPVTSHAGLALIGRYRVGSSLQVTGVETHRNWNYDVDGSCAGLVATVAW